MRRYLRSFALVVSVQATLAAPAPAGSALQRLIDTAIASPTTDSIKADHSAYDFDPAQSLRIYGATSLDITAAPGGTTLYFYCGAGVHIANSSKVRFVGFTIDYKRPCFAQGKVVRAPSPSSMNGDESVDILFDSVNFPSVDEIQGLAGESRWSSGPCLPPPRTSSTL